MAATDKQSRHKSRMERLKEKVDSGIASANQSRGITILLTGNGKGKTTAAFGNLVRCLGHDMQGGAVQFIKGQWQCGEVEFIKKVQPDFPYYAMKTDFTWESQNFEADKCEAEKAWAFAAELLTNPNLDLIVLDEITYMVSYKYLSLSIILDALKNRPSLQSVILTGRSAHRELIAFADTVSDVTEVKHAFHDGVMAQKGIDW